MIYGRTSDGGIFIGLSARNLELLQQGKPILREESNLPTLRIVYGETEQAIMDSLVREGAIDAALAAEVEQLRDANRTFAREADIESLIARLAAKEQKE